MEKIHATCAKRANAEVWQLTFVAKRAIIHAAKFARKRKKRKKESKSQIKRKIQRTINK